MRNGFDRAPQHSLFQVGLGSAAQAAAPAFLRVLSGAAVRLQNGSTTEEVAKDSLKLLAASPEVLTGFRLAVPVLHQAIESGFGERAAQVAERTLIAAGSDGDNLALHAFSDALAGDAGAELTLAATRGYAAGGVWQAAAEVTAAAVRIGASVLEPGTAGSKILTAVAPLAGNAGNLLAVGHALQGTVKTFRDPEATTNQKLAQVLHLVAAIGLCYVNPAALLSGVAVKALGSGGSTSA
jgi:hypothetical protein